MNALRDIKTAAEISVRLQSNEILAHLPQDTELGLVPMKIHEAGFKAGNSVWLTAKGSWNPNGFLPEGWTRAIPIASTAVRTDGVWEIEFHKDKRSSWRPQSVRLVESVPQIKDERKK